MEMATVNGAAAAQVGKDTGTLQPGMKADLIALDLDRTRFPYLDADMPVMEALLARASGADVRLTVVDGCVRYRDGVLTGLDRSALSEQVAVAALAARLPAVPEYRDLARQFQAHLSSHYAETTRKDSVEASCCARRVPRQGLRSNCQGGGNPFPHRSFQSHNRRR